MQLIVLWVGPWGVVPWEPIGVALMLAAVRGCSGVKWVEHMAGRVWPLDDSQQDATPLELYTVSLKCSKKNILCTYLLEIAMVSAGLWNPLYSRLSEL